MVITCPHCGSTFNYSAEQERAEARARCSVCKHIFHLAQGMPGAVDNPFLSSVNLASATLEISELWEHQEEELADKINEPSTSPVATETLIAAQLEKTAKSGKANKKGGKLKLVVVCLLIVLCTAVLIAYLFLREPPSGLTPEEKSRQERFEAVKDFVVFQQRAFQINNRYLNKILVVEGYVLNNSQHIKNLVKLEASIISPVGEVLLSKPFFAGSSVNELQLESMSEVELERWLSNNIEITRNNTNIQAGDRVAFMAVFTRLPEGALQDGLLVKDLRFRVTVVDALDTLDAIKK